MANLDPNDVVDEQAWKAGGQFRLAKATTLDAIYENITRFDPAYLQYQNERTRDGFWLALTQRLTPMSDINFGWARANPTPGDPGQHNTPGGANPDNMANMYTVAYKHAIDKHVSWYADWAMTLNHAAAHYDLGAGGRGLTTDCHDATPLSAFDPTVAPTPVSYTGPHCFAGGRLEGFSTGLKRSSRPGAEKRPLLTPAEHSAQDLDALETQAIAVIRDAYRLFAPCCVLWSMGKDSTALLWLMRKAFLGEVPMPVVQLDTAMELPEVYAFRDRIATEWQLDLHVELCPPEDACDPSLPPQTRAAARKTEGLAALLAREGYRAVFVGIRRDEQATRAKERVVSPRSLDGSWNVREQPPEFWGYTLTEVPYGGHVRVHPLLAWTEIDVWRYIKRDDIPFVPLYLARDGLRYRSLGEKNITVPTASQAATIDAIIEELATTREPERAGRTMDLESEASFERLRAGGYM